MTSEYPASRNEKTASEEQTMTERTIPCLPLISVDETLAFYAWLGFEVVHRQASPHVYLALRRGGFQLHFFGLAGLKPEAAYSTCLVIVPEVEPLHAAFASGLRKGLGRLPLAGFPRISRMKPGQSRFTVVDPAGNSVIYIRRDAPDDYDEGGAKPAPGRPLLRALAAAARLRDFRNDDRMAARVLDIALRKHPTEPAVDRARVLAARAEIAIAAGDSVHAAQLQADLAAVVLDDSERNEARRELEALATIQPVATGGKTDAP